jgi:hypothetical protein
MLTRRQKIVLKMYLAGLSVAKIAKAIGANVGMTYSIVKRLRNTKGVTLPYRRGRLDATVKTMLPKTTLFALDMTTGNLKKVAPPRPYNFRNHQIAKNIIGSIYARLRKVEALLK